ncbi:MAG: hypothetical protein M3011_04265 [Actinomycetota bacterium]|nr:hypothetical protein [Actinomycetota bacterium]
MKPLMRRRDSEGGGSFERQFLATIFIPNVQADRAALPVLRRHKPHDESVDSERHTVGRVV